ncbi:hypothetical protein GCM10010191_03780 [Actinomadura vinacea]|uniref:Uncharacterized protein n=1 Tax=Actinomadura vinacea TaxID=115336 RepID=A0ABP5VGH5_9ACTN
MPAAGGEEGGDLAPRTASPHCQIYYFSDHHLANLALCPDTITAAHRISVRYLHNLFQDE